MPGTTSPAFRRLTSWQARFRPSRTVAAVLTPQRAAAEIQEAAFVGFAPISDPRLIVAVMIDEPSAGKHYGGEVAAPVFSQVMGASLRTLGILPDAPVQVAEAVAGKGRL